MMAAGVAFGAPWPGPLLLDVAMVALALPVLLVGGEPLFDRALAARREGRWNLEVGVALLVLVGYASGVLALITAAPQLAGVAAIIVALDLTVRYVAGSRA